MFTIIDICSFFAKTLTTFVVHFPKIFWMEKSVNHTATSSLNWCSVYPSATKSSFLLAECPNVYPLKWPREFFFWNMSSMSQMSKEFTISLSKSGRKSVAVWTQFVLYEDDKKKIKCIHCSKCVLSIVSTLKKWWNKTRYRWMGTGSSSLE